MGKLKGKQTYNFQYNKIYIMFKWKTVSFYLFVIFRKAGEKKT